MDLPFHSPPVTCTGTVAYGGEENVLKSLQKEDLRRRNPLVYIGSSQGLARGVPGGHRR